MFCIMTLYYNISHGMSARNCLLFELTVCDHMGAFDRDRRGDKIKSQYAYFNSAWHKFAPTVHRLYFLLFKTKFQYSSNRKWDTYAWYTSVKYRMPIMSLLLSYQCYCDAILYVCTEMQFYSLRVLSKQILFLCSIK